MFTVERTGENRLDISMSGKLDSDDMKRALDELAEKADGIEDGQMLFDVIEYQLPSLAAIAVEFSRLPSMLHFIRQFRKAAVLTDKAWIGKISELEGALIPGLHIKAFGHDQKQEAEIWLASDSA
ncbi:STAS/SEC14 domain-containing protein [Microbulbifer marinus]|uniref:SpoIIAA-like n=1 Tax=Microbulbifer marinus TaxID=658218 RepID=A0A1H3VUI1_9GAMM|nr:STAS/SEC14 domain-containing protein [Microbulbifer marinus]SDZ77772.1 SpoIIAA-like [Microbulbifer marinus]